MNVYIIFYIGALHNIAAAKIYFPGWICRFYVTEDVPKDIIDQLKALGTIFKILIDLKPIQIHCKYI